VLLEPALSLALTPQLVYKTDCEEAAGGPVTAHAAAATGEAPDCAAMVEARGGRIKVVLGDRRLVKITDQSDLELVEHWLAPG